MSTWTQRKRRISKKVCNVSTHLLINILSWKLLLNTGSPLLNHFSHSLWRLMLSHRKTPKHRTHRAKSLEYKKQECEIQLHSFLEVVKKFSFSIWQILQCLMGAKIKLGWWALHLSLPLLQGFLYVRDEYVKRECYTGLQVLNWGISFLTKAEPSANAWNPHSSPSFHPYTLTTCQLSVVPFLISYV